MKNSSTKPQACIVNLNQNPLSSYSRITTLTPNTIIYLNNRQKYLFPQFYLASHREVVEGNINASKRKHWCVFFIFV